MAVFVKRILFFIAINYKNKSLLKYCWNKQKMEEYMNTATWKEGISAVSDMEDENINGSNNTDNILPDDGVSNGRNSKSDEKREKDEKRDQKISDYGQVTLDENNAHHKIHLLSIIGEIEGHENLNSSQKTTKYEHVLPQLAAIADSTEVDGLLVLLNTVGGDVESGLAIAEMITTLGKPSVSLVLGGGHSIGVPLAVATDYSYIVPSGTMIIHPVRMSGTVIGAKQTYDYFKRIQDRILGFVAGHSGAPKEKLESMMMNRSRHDIGRAGSGGLRAD